YNDKHAEKQVELNPSNDQVLISFRDTEGTRLADVAHRFRLKFASPRPRGSPYQLFTLSETEEVPRALTELKAEPGVQKVLPSFRDQEGERRYVDPEYCVVQFLDGINDARQREILDLLGLQIYERHRTLGF